MEVSGLAALLTTETATVGTVIEEKRITDLPLNGRNFFSLVALSPNVTYGFTPAAQAAGREGGSRAAVTMSLAGARATWSNYTLDGITNTDVNFNLYIVLPSVDALQEFKVQTGIYPAEFGRAAGQVNVSTKGGGNQYHGTAFDYLRNDALDAKNYDFLNTRPAKSPYRQNQYGFTLAGPVRIPKLFNGKNRLFFMSNFEGFKSRTTRGCFGHHADAGHAQWRFFRRHHRPAGSAHPRGLGAQCDLFAVPGKPDSGKPVRSRIPCC